MQRQLRILVTRTRLQASALAEGLEAHGFLVESVPLIELVAPSSFAPLDEALRAAPSAFDWVIFTSANAVWAFADRAAEQGLTLHPQRVAAIGPATMRAVAETRLVPRPEDVLIAAEYSAESLLRSLLENTGGVRRSFLLVRAEEARDVIPAGLEAAGHRVVVAPAYRNRTPPEAGDGLRRLFGSPESLPDAITFTSSSTARRLFAALASTALSLPAGTALASIGPVTSATLRELGHEPDIEAMEPTIESLVAAVCEWAPKQN